MQPLISIVTPSYNQAQFLEDTLDSVLGQNFSPLEYIVMDGGSRDGSPDLIRRRQEQLAYWQSQKDGGQGNAINAGFSRATGDLLGWLNSDDIYLPGTLAHVAALLDPARPQILCGNCVTMDPEGHRASYSGVPEKLRQHDLTLWDYVIQPSTFWTRAAWQKVGPLDETLHFAFDWDWFIRAKKAGVEFLGTERPLSIYRIHSGHKSGSSDGRRDQELALIYERHHGPAYATAFLKAVRRRSELQRFMRRLKKCGLENSQISLSRLRFRGVFAGMADREVRHLLAML